MRCERRDGSRLADLRRPGRSVEAQIRGELVFSRPRFLLHIFAAFAEMEREIIRERVRAGVRAAKAEETPLGRPRHLFQRDKAIELRSKGVSWPQTAAPCGRTGS